jgi:BirA family biotin operon repressor/biotin-[acetyl-CoA-carboxylase] ligase
MSEIKWVVEHHDRVSSTQDVAKLKARDGAPEGTVVVAEIQESGRGRLARHWLSPSGGLWFSIVLRPGLSIERVQGIVLLSAVSLARAIRGRTGLDAGIKWPNDILIGWKKAAGLLLETQIQDGRPVFVILGAGVNVNNDTAMFPPDLLVPPTSLKEETGRDIDMESLLNAFLTDFAASYNLLKTDFDRILEDWRHLSVTLDMQVKVTQMDKVIAGRAVDIDDTGALLVRLPNGNVFTVHAGDLTIEHIS